MITSTLEKQGSSDYIGVHDDDKPTAVPVNTLFLELDTGDIYYFDGENWQKVGGN